MAFIFPRKFADGPVVSPKDQDEIAEALGRQSGNKVVRSGAIAANRVGLTNRIEVGPVYLTDGHGKCVLTDWYLS